MTLKLEAHNTTRVGVWAKLHAYMTAHPDARIMTVHPEVAQYDGCEEELSNVLYHERTNTIELVF